MFFEFVKVSFMQGSISSPCVSFLMGSTIIVLVFAIILGLFLWLLDDKLLGPVTGWIYGGAE